MIASLLLLALTLLGSCAVATPSTSRRTQLVFDTPCTVTIYQRNAGNVLDAVFNEMDRIDRMMNAYQESSVVAALNRRAGGEPTEVPEELFRVIETAVAFGQVSGGAFDPTIGPLVDLWDIGGENPRVPSELELEETRSLIEYADILLLDYQQQVLLKRRGMGINLGGIAKGYAADRAAELLRSMGVDRAIIDFGGNIYAVGARESDAGWRIGIQNPVEPRGNFLGILEVEDLSVVTSGVYERYFIEAGTRYHHILDPATGRPVDNGILSVTIISASSMTADALATAVFVLGLEAGSALVESYSGVEAIFVTDTMEVVTTSGVGDTFTLNAEEFTLRSAGTGG